VEALGRLKIFLSRYEVIGGLDAWTLIPVMLALLAVVAAFACYFWSLYRRLRSPSGVDWDAELGIDPSRISPSNPRDRFSARLRLAAMGAFSLFMGASAALTGHFSNRERGHRYSADGASARVAGGILCAAGLMLGLAALFQNSKVLNRPLGGREREP
jgi:hypothetical protein